MNIFSNESQITALFRGTIFSPFLPVIAQPGNKPIKTAFYLTVVNSNK